MLTQDMINQPRSQATYAVVRYCTHNAIVRTGSLDDMTAYLHSHAYGEHDGGFAIIPIDDTTDRPMFTLTVAGR